MQPLRHRYRQFSGKLQQLHNITFDFRSTQHSIIRQPSNLRCPSNQSKDTTHQIQASIENHNIRQRYRKLYSGYPTKSSLNIPKESTSPPLPENHKTQPLVQRISPKTSHNPLHRPLQPPLHPPSPSNPPKTPLKIQMTFINSHSLRYPRIALGKPPQPLTHHPKIKD